MKGPLINVGGGPDVESVVAVAESLAHLLQVGAENRVAESVMHAALDVMRASCKVENITVSNCVLNGGGNKSVEV